MSTKSITKGLRRSDATVLPPLDIVKLNFGQLIDLALGQTEDSKNYGAVSFGLLRELLLAIVDRMGVRQKVALAYDSQTPPKALSAANSPMNSLHGIPPIKSKKELEPTDEQTADQSTSELVTLQLKTSAKSKEQSSDGHTEQPQPTETRRQSADHPTQSADPRAQSADPPTQSAEPRAQSAEPNAQTTDPQMQGLDHQFDPLTTHDPDTQSPPSKTDPADTYIDIQNKDQAESELHSRTRANSLLLRLGTLEQTVMGLSKGAMALPKPGTPERDEHDMETRLVNIEDGMTVMTGIIEKVRDKVAKVNKKIDIIDKDSDVDYEKRKPSKPKKKIKEKSNSDVFNEQIRKNSGHSASDIKGSKGGLERRYTKADDADNKVSGIIHEDDTEYKAHGRLEPGSDHRPRDVNMADTGVFDRQYIDEIYTDLQYCKEKINDAEEQMLAQKRGTDRLKKFVVGGLDQVDTQLSACVTWNQLEKHINRKQTAPDPEGKPQYGLSELVVGFAQDELQRNQLNDTMGDQQPWEKGGHSQRSSGFKGGPGANQAGIAGRRSSGMTSPTQNNPAGQTVSHPSQPGHPQYPAVRTGLQTGPGGQMQDRGPNNQAGRQMHDLNNRDGRHTPQGGHGNQGGRQMQHIGYDNQGGGSAQAGGPNNQHGRQTQDGGYNNQDGRSRQDGVDNYQGGRALQQQNVQQVPTTNQSRPQQDTQQNGPNHHGGEFGISSQPRGANSPSVQATQPTAGGHPSQQKFAQGSGNLPQQNQGKAGTPVSSILAQPSSKPILLPESESRVTTAASSPIGSQHNVSGPGSNIMKSGAMTPESAQRSGLPSAPQHYPGRQTGPTGQMLEWQDKLGRLVSESESDTKRGGPSVTLKRTLESLADVSQKHGALEGIIEGVSQSKANKSELSIHQEITDDKLRHLEAALRLQEHEVIAFRELVQHVSASKVDRDYLNFALSMKSDKKEMAELIDMKYFTNITKVLEDSVEGINTKLKTLERESNWKSTAEKLLNKLKTKAEKDEVLSIKKILQNFDAKLHELTLKDFALHTDEAVAFRKQMMPFNCLSCSKTLNMDSHKMPTSLPMEPGVTGYKTHRPYTAYELKSIREQLQDRGEDRYDVYSAPRPVGGTYTMVDPLRHLRHARNNAVYEELVTGEPSQLPTGGQPYPTVNVYNQVVVGHDGKIYKGNHNDKLPEITTNPAQTQSGQINPSFTDSNQRKENSPIIPTIPPKSPSF